MTTWRFDEGYAYPAGFQCAGCFRRNIDTPAMIAAGLDAGLINNSTGDPQSLESTGWGSADVLQAFRVPAGFALRFAGVRITTVEGGTLTMDIGNASATQTHRLAAGADDYVGTINGNNTAGSGGIYPTLIDDADLGGSTYEAVVFITNGTIDITFNNAADAVIFDVWACGYRLW